MRRLSLFLLFCLPMMLFSQESIEKRFPVKKGNLRFSKENFKLNRVNTGEIRRDSVAIYNAGKQAIDLAVNMKSSYMQFVIRPARLEAGKSGYFTLLFDAGQKGDFGNSYEGITLSTSDPVDPEKYFFLMAFIEEDFSGLSAEERANAPVMKFEREGFDFGKVKKGEKIITEFAFTNAGKRDLIIRKIKASCGCTTTEPEKSTIRPGEKSKIKVTIDTSTLGGEQNKSVFVFCNDPAYSSITLSLTGLVE
jgi:hypothetical protein